MPAWLPCRLLDQTVWLTGSGLGSGSGSSGAGSSTAERRRVREPARATGMTTVPWSAFDPRDRTACAALVAPAPAAPAAARPVRAKGDTKATSVMSKSSRMPTSTMASSTTNAPRGLMRSASVEESRWPRAPPPCSRSL